MVGIALVGCGTVGGATAQLLTRDRELLRRKSGLDLELRYIVDKNFDVARSLGLPEETFTEELEKALADPEVEIVIELVGGTGFAKELIESALEAGKHVVTANKALLAHHGEELWALARTRGRAIAFEASCGGGIPIIRSLVEGLVANEVDALYGIVNGTCNFILTEMIEEGKSYEAALADAQARGLAEADPALDVGGMDSAHKIAIMSALAFGLKVDFDAIPVEGIDGLSEVDVAFGSTLGYMVKLLAVSYRTTDGVTLWVRPAFISREHPLAWVKGPFNAVSVYGHATGHTLYYGRGAGGQPTASAVVSDVVSLGLGTFEKVFQAAGQWQDINTLSRQVHVEETAGRFYIRTMVTDSPGMLAKLSSIFAEHAISIASVLQNELPEEAPQSGTLVPVVITTHRAQERSVREAVALIDALPGTGSRSTVIPILDEHPEELV
ncbi:MAG: homoserine dehydrogenase [Spirochaetaceae bacterium]